jgi:hypothetical protein
VNVYSPLQRRRCIKDRGITGQRAPRASCNRLIKTELQGSSRFSSGGSPQRHGTVLPASTPGSTWEWPQGEHGGAGIMIYTLNAVHRGGIPDG